MTYVNAEVDDGTALAKMMKYFKTTDPQDMSQGELSNRVHFLKCEEGGYKVMCEMSEKWVEEGRIEGEERKAKEERTEGNISSNQSGTYSPVRKRIWSCRETLEPILQFQRF